MGKIHSIPSFRILLVRVSCSFDAPRDVTRGGGAQPGSGEEFMRHEATLMGSLSLRWRKMQVGHWYFVPPLARLSCAHLLTPKTHAACCKPSPSWRLFMELLGDIVPDHEDPVSLTSTACASISPPGNFSAASAMAPVMNGLREFQRP